MYNLPIGAENPRFGGVPFPTRVFPWWILPSFISVLLTWIFASQLVHQVGLARATQSHNGHHHHRVPDFREQLKAPGRSMEAISPVLDQAHGSPHHGLGGDAAAERMWQLQYLLHRGPPKEDYKSPFPQVRDLPETSSPSHVSMCFVNPNRSLLKPSSPKASRSHSSEGQVDSRDQPDPGGRPSPMGVRGPQFPGPK